jgi:hypothetical protein
MRTRIVLGMVGLLLTLWFVPPASAASFTLGAVAPTTGFSATCSACSDVQFATDPASPSYVVPPVPPGGGPWTLTSWGFRGGNGMGTATARVLVWRHTSTPNEVKLIDASGDAGVASGAVANITASIPVLPGDLIGLRSGSNTDPDYSSSFILDKMVGAVGDPALGETTGAPTSTYAHIETNSDLLNVSATLTATDPPASSSQPTSTAPKKKCKKKKKSAAVAKKKCKKHKKK